MYFFCLKIAGTISSGGGMGRLYVAVYGGCSFYREYRDKCYSLGAPNLSYPHKDNKPFLQLNPSPVKPL